MGRRKSQGENEMIDALCASCNQPAEDHHRVLTDIIMSPFENAKVSYVLMCRKSGFQQRAEKPHPKKR
jgi:hypothetical protein